MGSVGHVRVAVADENITNIAEVNPGASVTLKGKVTRILDEDEFRLEDETGSIKVYIGWKNRVMVDVGETVTVKGVVDNDLVDVFRPEVYARELVREDGTVVKLK
jgi:uncharacterized protein YdeI (BOF family)